MNSDRPPVVAGWLLERFCADAGLAGDLIEEYRARQSRVWYWKQALAAVCVYPIAQIIEHKWLAIRAIATGYVIWYFVNNMFLHGVLKPVMDTSALRVAYIFIGYACWIANGWIIARLHRPYSTAMVMAYVLWAIVASVPAVYDAASDPNGWALGWEIASRLATLLSITIGGLLSTYRDQLRQIRPAGPDWRAYAAR